METSNDSGVLELKDEIGESDSSDSDVQIIEIKSGHREYIVDTSGGDRGSELDDNSAINLSNVISHFTDDTKAAERKSKGRRSGQSCFNCDSTQHTARECTLPRNSRRISQNRNSFMKRREGSGRFHEDSDVKDVAPGKVSNRLREALGIGDRDLPEWIYRMRKLGFNRGYPPAYMKRSTVVESVFKFHIGDGAATGSENRKRKQSENDGTILEIDPAKVIKYPGFNYDDGNFRDQKREHFEVPPFEKFIEAQQIYLKQMDALRRQQKEEEEKQHSPKAKKRRVDRVEADEEEEEECEMLHVEGRRSSGSAEEGEIREVEISVDTTNITLRRGKKKKKERRRISPVQTETVAAPTTTNVDNKEDEEGEPAIEEGIDGQKVPSPPILETPVLMGSNISALQEVLKPSLESFAKSIQPFQHQQQGSCTGFIKKLHEIIRTARRK